MLWRMSEEDMSRWTCYMLSRRGGRGRVEMQSDAGGVRRADDRLPAGV
jgi:hypothetical protein